MGEGCEYLGAEGLGLNPDYGFYFCDLGQAL